MGGLIGALLNARANNPALIPENVFRRAVGVLILALGAYMVVRALGGSS